MVMARKQSESFDGNPDVTASAASQLALDASASASKLAADAAVIASKLATEAAEGAKNIAIVDTKVSMIEKQISKLEDTVMEIKDNHLAHLNIAVNNLQFALQGVPSMASEVKEIKAKIMEQEFSVKAVKDVRKLMWAIAIFLLPYAGVMLLELVQKLGWVH
jgi:hypothetical protein